MLEAQGLANLADALADGGVDYARADELYARAVAIQRDLGNSHMIGATLGDWSQNAAYESAHERALALAQEALTVFRGLNDQLRVMEMLIRIGQYGTWAGDVEPARAALREALALLQTFAHPHEVARLAEACADVAVARGDCERGAVLLGFSDEWRATRDLARPKPLKDRLERCLQTSRAALGDDRFAAAVRGGRALTLEAALQVLRPVLD
jgi:hypothetical protein